MLELCKQRVVTITSELWELPAAEPKEEPSGSDSEDANGPSLRAPMGFGGITRSVIKAAEASGKHRAPVFRLEEMHRVK